MLDDYQLPAIERASSFFKSNLGWTIEKLSPPDPTTSGSSCAHRGFPIAAPSTSLSASESGNLNPASSVVLASDAVVARPNELVLERCDVTSVSSPMWMGTSELRPSNSCSRVHAASGDTC